MLELTTTIASIIGTAVIAIATVFLWLTTRSLAKYTSQLVKVTSCPHVVASIDQNRWSWKHVDLRVDNTGNATAYDIHVAFEPPLENDEPRPATEPIPFQRVSVLKPGQGVSSYISRFDTIAEKVYEVKVSWRRDPSKEERESNEYTIKMTDLEGMSRLGPSDPLTEIANQIGKLRGDWQAVAKGSRKMQVDVVTSGDRLHKRRILDRQRRQRASGNARQADQDAGSGNAGESEAPGE